MYIYNKCMHMYRLYGKYLNFHFNLQKSIPYGVIYYNVFSVRKKKFVHFMWNNALITFIFFPSNIIMVLEKLGYILKIICIYTYFQYNFLFNVQKSMLL